MSDFSPCAIGEIIAWNRDEKYVRTTLGDFPYNEVRHMHGEDWVVVRLGERDFAPVCIGLWQRLQDAPANH